MAEHALKELTRPTPAAPTVCKCEVVEDHEGTGLDRDLSLRVGHGKSVIHEEIELRRQAAELVATEEVGVALDAR